MVKTQMNARLSFYISEWRFVCCLRYFIRFIKLFDFLQGPCVFYLIMIEENGLFYVHVHVHVHLRLLQEYFKLFAVDAKRLPHN